MLDFVQVALDEVEGQHAERILHLNRQEREALDYVSESAFPQLWNRRARSVHAMVPRAIRFLNVTPRRERGVKRWGRGVTR